MSAVVSGSVAAAPRFPARPDGTLDAAMRSAYARDGFLILEGFLDRTTCDTLQDRIARLIAEFDPATTRTVFSAKTQAHARDRYFLESGGAIRFFLEDDVLDAQGHLTVAKDRALNKIGHALHDLDPVFAEVSRRPQFAALAAALGLAYPLLLQSMYIFKQPFIGGEVGWHQDATFLYTSPVSVVGLWAALDDATVENGCMTALAGAHRGPLRRRFLREDDGMTMKVLDETPWPEDAPVAIEVSRGSLVVLHGLLPHASGPNQSPRPRHAYALHLIDAAADYPAGNWLQRPQLPLRGFT
jgi:phytanoyl-CoA hydroxylase